MRSTPYTGESAAKRSTSGSYTNEDPPAAWNRNSGVRSGEPSRSTRMLPSTAASVNGRSRSATSAIVVASASCWAVISPPERSDSRAASAARVASSTDGSGPVTPGAAAPVTTAQAPKAMRSVSSRGAMETALAPAADAPPTVPAPPSAPAPETAPSTSRSAPTSTAPSPRACWAASSPTSSGFSTAKVTMSATSPSEASRIACSSSGGMANSCSTRFLIRTAISESRPRSSSGNSRGRSSGLYPIEDPTIRARRSTIFSPESGSQRPSSASSSSLSSITGPSDSADT